MRIECFPRRAKEHWTQVDRFHLSKFATNPGTAGASPLGLTA